MRLKRPSRSTATRSHWGAMRTLMAATHATSAAASTVAMDSHANVAANTTANASTKTTTVNAYTPVRVALFSFTSSRPKTRRSRRSSRSSLSPFRAFFILCDSSFADDDPRHDRSHALDGALHEPHDVAIGHAELPALAHVFLREPAHHVIGPIR